MTFRIVVGLGYSSISLQAITTRLNILYGDKAGAVQTPDSHIKPEDFVAGCNAARNLALSLWREYKAPLTIGVVRAPYKFECSGMKMAMLDVAVVLKNGALSQRVEELNRASCKRIAMGALLRESTYAHEGLLALEELIKIHYRALSLGQTL